MRIAVTVSDIIVTDPCPMCGSTEWIVDSNGALLYWLLCLDPRDIGCEHTKPIPTHMDVGELS